MRYRHCCVRRWRCYVVAIPLALAQMVAWLMLATRRDWDGDTGGYGRLRIQRGGKGLKKRYYLMSLP